MSPNLENHQIVLAAFGTSTDSSSIYTGLNELFEGRFEQKIPMGFTSRVGEPKLKTVLENISSKNKECIILTDLDKTGKQLYGKLSHGLQQFGVKIDNNFRNFLFKNTKLRQIEGLATYIENNGLCLIKGRRGGKKQAMI